MDVFDVVFSDITDVTFIYVKHECEMHEWCQL